MMKAQQELPWYKDDIYHINSVPLNSQHYLACNFVYNFPCFSYDLSGEKKEVVRKSVCDLFQLPWLQ